MNVIRWLLRKPKCNICKQRTKTVTLYKETLSTPNVEKSETHYLCDDCKYIRQRTANIFGIRIFDNLAPVFDKEKLDLQDEMKDILNRRKRF